MTPPTTSPLCKCGHKKEEHFKGYNETLGCLYRDEKRKVCKCNKFISAQEVSKGDGQGFGSVKKDDTEGNPKPLWSSGKMQTEMGSEWSSSKEPLETSHTELGEINKRIREQMGYPKYGTQNNGIIDQAIELTYQEIKFSSIPRSEVEKLRDGIESSPIIYVNKNHIVWELNKLLKEGK